MESEEVKIFLNALPDDRKEVIEQIRHLIKVNFSEKIEEVLAYGMINYVVPYSVYPAGYHCNPKQPLPFIALASQKNFIAIYHMGIYADQEIHDWFVGAWPTYSKQKLDIGKSCIRIKKTADVPFELFNLLFKKMSVEKWVHLYDSIYVRKK